MLAALLTLIAGALAPLVLGLLPGAAGRRMPGYAAILAAGAALALALLNEGLEGSLLGLPVPWPQPLEWLSEIPFLRSDAVGAGLGALALLLGWATVVQQAAAGASPGQLAASLLTCAVLYGLLHTSNLLAFSALLVALVALVWAHHAMLPGAGSANDLPGARGLFALGAGAISLLAAALFIGRTAGGGYDLAALPLPALSAGVLALIALFAFIWIGAAPFTGWSAEPVSGPLGAYIQAVVPLLPVLALLLRAQSLVSTQSLAGSLPENWLSFNTALVWVGAITAVAGAAGTLRAAGTPRFMTALTASYGGITLWALGLDTPQGRVAAVAVAAAYALSRVAWELSRTAASNEAWGTLPRWAAALSLAGVPLSASFAGVWLVGAALTERGSASLVLLLAGVVVAAACGVVLHLAIDRPGAKLAAPYQAWASIALAVTVVAAGVVPGLWLGPAERVAAVTAIAAGSDALATTGGIRLEPGRGDAPLELPMLPLAAGILLFVGLAWAVVALTQRGARRGGLLLPTAIERLRVQSRGQDTGPAIIAPLLRSTPRPVHLLSIGTLTDALWVAGRLVSAGTIRAGSLLGRLEGRFYMALALVAALILLLAVTR